LAERYRYRAFSSSANLGPGFDVVAVALDAFYDEVELTIRPGAGRVITVFTDPSIPGGLENTAAQAALGVLKRYGRDIDVEIKVRKGIPVGRGLGSSGATAAAVVRGLNEALGLGLDAREEMLLAGRAEAAAAGEPHYDNVAASLLGGLVIIYNASGTYYTISIPIEAWFVIAVPHIRVPRAKTKTMRSIIPRTVSLKLHVADSGRLAALIAGLLTGQWLDAGRGMEDEIITPFRAKHVPCFEEARAAALRSGAFGFTISGAGPSTIALVEGGDRVDRVAQAIKIAYEECGVAVKVKDTRPAPGAHRVD